jgi:hypothetical protein
MTLEARDKPKRKSVYWEKTMKPEYILWKKWHPATSAPTDGSIFMGRQLGSNRAFAVKWNGEAYVRPWESEPIIICQWISLTEYADIRSCVWASASSIKDCYE